MHTLKFCQLGNKSESDYPKQISYEENHPIKTLWNLDRLFLAEQNTSWQFHNGRYKLIFPILITLKMRL